MPIYEYQCNECGRTTELLQRLSDPPLASCPDCGGAVRKLFSAPAVQFKGSGWYVTDYAGKGRPAEGNSGNAEAGGGKAADGKAAAKADPKPSSSNGAAASKTGSGSGGGS